MMPESKQPLKLFYCYARKDKDLRDELDIHLSNLKRQNLISSWHDGEIGPGQNWEKEIDNHLQEAHIILLLVTPHFMASDYCYSVEMEHALERHRAGKARVIPIILRRTLWEDAPFSFIQALPTDAKPLAQWPDRDEAFYSIATGIRSVITELHILLKTAQDWVDEGIALMGLKQYNEALAALDHAILLNPNNAHAYYNKGQTLRNLKRYEEAIATFNQTMLLNPNPDQAQPTSVYMSAYLHKRSILRKLKLDILDQITHQPGNQ